MMSPASPSPIIIAIDGYAASGKGTLARRLATHYNYAYLDSGKLYRLVAHHLLNKNLPLTEGNASAAATDLGQAIPFALMDDDQLRQEEVSEAAMTIAAFEKTRAALKAVQQDFAARPYLSNNSAADGAVIDGRDIGTVICPAADVKFFISADVEVRAQRRVQDLQETVAFDKVLADLQKRDTADENRKIAPLKRADDAIAIDTSSASVDESLQACIKAIDKKLNR